jgi:Lrp/AsnC family transcriptional regulator, leucine-responsive regulatory protein
MKLGEEHPDLDEIDRHILALMQENCRLPLAKIGEHVGLSAPSVMERVKKLEDGGIITAYRAVLNARRLGKDITAFIGVSTGHPHAIHRFEREIEALDDVLECHHVTGTHTLMIKAKTQNTSSLEELISRIRSIEGVVRTETMVVLSTHTEHMQVPVEEKPPIAKRGRRAEKLHLKGLS